MKNRFTPLHRVLFAAAAVTAGSFSAQAQNVGVGTTAPDASAALDIVSSNKGALLPRVASTSSITSPATGLIVYQTGGTAGFYYNAGTPGAPNWQQLATAAGATVTANNGLTKTGQNIALGGTLTQATNIAQAGNNFSLTGGNVGIGTSTPSGQLEVGSPSTTGALTIDQQQTTGTAGQGQVTPYQSFTAGISGQLQQVTIYAGGVNPGGSPPNQSTPAVLQIFQGTGTGGTLLATQNFTLHANWYQAITITFTLPANVVAGQVYSWALSGLNPNFYAATALCTNNCYTGGTSSSDPNFDFNFQTRVAPVIAGQSTLFANNGRVGVGTGVPSATLDVDGTTRLRGLTVPGLVQTDASGNLSSASTASFGTNFIQNQNAADQVANFRISGSGSVLGNFGVGTAAPQLGLDVATGYLGVRNGAAWDHQYWQHDGATALYRAGGAESGLAFQLGTGASGTYNGQPYNEVMRLLPGGNVGIGTNAPAQLLQLGSISYAANSLLRIGAGNGNASRLWDLGVQVNSANTNDVTGENYDFAIRDASANATRMLVEWNTGNVGIGTSAPTANLDVNGTTRLRGLTVPGLVQTDASGNLSSAAGSTFGTNFILNQTTQQSASNFNISGNGTVGGALTANGGATISGTTVINGAGSTATTNIGTGGSSGDVTIGRSGGNVTVIGPFNTAGNAVINGTGSTASTSIGTGAGAAPVTIGRSGGVVRLPVLTTAGIVTTDASGNLSSGTAASLDATTASNGLTEVGSDIRLGGNLTAATTIGLGANNLTFTSTTGTVGIGASSAARLHVRGTGNAFPVNTGTTQSVGLISRLQTSDNAILDMGGNSVNGFWLQSTDITALNLKYPLLLNPNGGRVGIGTTTPGAQLEVQGGTPIDDTTPVNSTQTLTRLYRPGTFDQSYGAAAELALGRYNVNTASDAQFAQLDVKLGNNSNALADQTVMTLRGDGNVGIGTTTPAQKLEVNGNVFIPSANDYLMRDTNHGMGWYGAGKTWNGLSPDGPVVYGYGGGLLGTNQGGARATALYWNAAGNVGIGTTTPGARLDVVGGGGSTIDLTVNGRLRTGDGNNLGGMWVNGAGTQFMGQYDASAMGLYNNGWRMVVNNTGNVGIGTTTPGARLNVEGGGIQVGGNGTINSQGAHLQWNRSGFEGETWLINQYGGGGAQNHGIRFGSSDGSNTFANVTEWARFDRNGNFGIGTTAPNAKLGVTSSDATQVNIVSTSGDPNGVVNLTIPATNNACADCSEFMIFNKAGVGGIGSIQARLNSNSVTYNTTSDKRLKENITHTRLGLQDLMKIEVKDYNFIGTPTASRTTGFLAQDLFKIFPDAVKEGDHGTTVTNKWAVDYGRLTPLLVQAIQDQQAEIEALKAQNAALQSKAAQAEADHASLLTLQAQMAKLLGETAPADAQARK